MGQRERRWWFDLFVCCIISFPWTRPSSSLQFRKNEWLQVRMNMCTESAQLRSGKSCRALGLVSVESLTRLLGSFILANSIRFLSSNSNIPILHFLRLSTGLTLLGSFSFLPNILSQNSCQELYAPSTQSDYVYSLHRWKIMCIVILFFFPVLQNLIMIKHIEPYLSKN